MASPIVLFFSLIFAFLFARKFQSGEVSINPKTDKKPKTKTDKKPKDPDSDESPKIDEKPKIDGNPKIPKIDENPKIDGTPKILDAIILFCFLCFCICICLCFCLVYVIFLICSWLVNVIFLICSVLFLLPRYVFSWGSKLLPSVLFLLRYVFSWGSKLLPLWDKVLIDPSTNSFNFRVIIPFCCLCFCLICVAYVVSTLKRRSGYLINPETDKKPKKPESDKNPNIDEKFLKVFHHYIPLIFFICFVLFLLGYVFSWGSQLLPLWDPSTNSFNFRVIIPLCCLCFCLICVVYVVSTPKRRSGHSMGQQKSRHDLVHEFVCNGDVDAIKFLCRERASLECMDRKGRTPLIVASMHAGLYNVVKSLIELGANVNAYRPGRHGGTPLHHAAKRGLNETVKLLLSRSANALVRNDDCHTPLNVARTKGYTSVVRTIENHICYFSGWLRENCGSSFVGALILKSLSRKIWVVVMPCGSSNPRKPLKFELVIYATSQDIQPRTVIALWNAQIQETKFSKLDPSLSIFDKSTKSRYTFASFNWSGQAQIQQLYNACRGIQGMSPPVVHDAATETQSATEAAKMPMATSASLHSAASEASKTNGLGNSSVTTSQNGNSSADGITGSEASTSGWINEPGNEQHSGRESGVTGIPAEPSAPPLPEEGLNESPIHTQTIDTSPVDLSVPAEVNEDGGGSTSSSCAICFEGPAAGACIPCGHMVGCVTCLNEIKSKKGLCPVCRAKIDQVTRIYTV